MQVSENITQRSASNLALAFILLPPEKRLAMSALYAFCREVDDVADEESRPVEERRLGLSAWREDVRAACEGGPVTMPVNRELQPHIRQYHLPFALFDDLIRGVEMDLDLQVYETFEQLDLYCYRVASVVGLLSIEIFGYTNPRCHDYAVHLGRALQYTNILRDVRNDAERGRIYLPAEALRKHGVKPEEILRFEYSGRFRNLADDIAGRAANYYRMAREALPSEDRRSMATAELMGSVYWGLFEKLRNREYNVFGPQVTRLSKFQKAVLIARMWLRANTGATQPNYGVF
ncbi:MAG TPA: presqualene diphosphate synthase HpnD [Roseimicrobium sp.]|nr:presqualene diphosphate synthase HpnD [Roseimicrobium sp.]